ncbi:MAG: hypothetical protein ACE5IK_05705 [Acidobacteriota bacterium]
MKTARLLIALALLVPALSVAQEKYTNADLARLTPQKDAYTNADLSRLAPLPQQAAPAAAATPVRLVPPSPAERARADRQAARQVAHDQILAEIGYWEDIIATAHRPMTSDPNEYPHVGGDTSQARSRLVLLRRLLYMQDVGGR